MGMEIRPIGYIRGMSHDSHVIRWLTTLMEELLDGGFLRVEHQSCHVVVVEGVMAVLNTLIPTRTEVVTSLIPKTQITLECS